MVYKLLYINKKSKYLLDILKHTKITYCYKKIVLKIIINYILTICLLFYKYMCNKLFFHNV